MQLSALGHIQYDANKPPIPVGHRIGKSTISPSLLYRDGEIYANDNVLPQRNA